MPFQLIEINGLEIKEEYPSLKINKVAYSSKTAKQKLSNTMCDIDEYLKQQ